MWRSSRLISSIAVVAIKRTKVASRFMHSSWRLSQSSTDGHDNIITTYTANAGNAPTSSSGTAAADPTIFDTEKEMFQIRRKMTSAYSLGKYQMALDFALELESKATQIMGTRNAVYASCLNNVALMYKMLGEQDAAMEKYTAALHVYMDVTGKDHVSYAATLSNLGVLYKDMSKGRVVSRNNSDSTADDEHDVVVVPVKGMEKLQLLERAEEALVEARDTRIRLLGKAHRDSLYSTLHLASLWKMRSNGSGGAKDKAAEAQRLLEEALSIAQETYGDADVICGSLHNDLGVLYKSKGLHDQALVQYTRALEIRSKVLGDTHNDTVVTVYNLAELHTSMGNTDLATELQEALVTTLQGRGDKQNGANKQGQQQSESGTSNNDGNGAAQATMSHERSILRGRLELNVTKNNTTIPSNATSSSGMYNRAGPTSPGAPTPQAPPMPAAEAEKMNIADVIARDLGTTGAKDKAGAGPGAEEDASKKAPVQTFASRTNKPATRRKPATSAPTN